MIGIRHWTRPNYPGREEGRNTRDFPGKPLATQDAQKQEKPTPQKPSHGLIPITRMRTEEYIPGSKYLLYATATCILWQIRNVRLVSLTAPVTEPPAIYTIPAPLGPIWPARRAIGQRLERRAGRAAEGATSTDINPTWTSPCRLGPGGLAADPGCCHPQDGRPQFRQELAAGDRPPRGLHQRFLKPHGLPPGEGVGAPSTTRRRSAHPSRNPHWSTR
jgi:hypothetical protein